MVSACEAALESPQIPPEARERIQSFLKLYGEASAAMEERRADVFVRRLIERVGLRRQRLFAAQPEVAERLLGLSRLAELASAWARREPHGSTRDFVRLPERRRRGRRRAGRRRGAALAGRGAGHRPRRGQGHASSTTSSCSGSRTGARSSGSGGRPAPGSSSPGSSAATAARARPSRFYEQALAASRRRGGGARGGAVRPRRGPARDLPQPARGGAGGVLAGGARALGAAPGHGGRRQPGDRPLPGAAEAGGARPAPRRRGDGGGGRGGQRAAAPGRDARAAGRARRLLARLLPARLRARARTAAGG